MRSGRPILATASYAGVLILCTMVTCLQGVLIARHLITRQQKESVPAFGEADVVYFSEPTCPACKVTSPTIHRLRRQYPQYRIARVDTATPAGIALQEEYSQAYKLPARDQGRIPIAFAGRRYFLGVAAITGELPAHLRAGLLVTHDAGARPRRSSQPPEEGRVMLTRRFARFSIAPILIAGLIDSINPCATATLIFFLSYLAWARRTPRDLLWVGGLFTLGVFLTYFLIGMGLLHALRSLEAFPFLTRALYPAAALVMLALALISFLDYRRARHGDTASIALQLPRGVKQWLHRVIRTQMGPRTMGLAAFWTAVLVSLLEFTCTSQVYLPTLMYMAQTGGQRLRATGLLLLYNLMFVLPLIALFTAAYFGVSTRTLAKLAVRHTATVKLAMSLLFLSFTVYLLSVSVRMFTPG